MYQNFRIRPWSSSHNPGRTSILNPSGNMTRVYNAWRKITQRVKQKYFRIQIVGLKALIRSPLAAVEGMKKYIWLSSATLFFSLAQLISFYINDAACYVWEWGWRTLEWSSPNVLEVPLPRWSPPTRRFASVPHQRPDRPLEHHAHACGHACLRFWQKLRATPLPSVSRVLAEVPSPFLYSRSPAPC